MRDLGYRNLPFRGVYDSGASFMCDIALTLQGGKNLLLDCKEER